MKESAPTPINVIKCIIQSQFIIILFFVDTVAPITLKYYKLKKETFSLGLYVYLTWNIYPIYAYTY